MHCIFDSTFGAVWRAAAAAGLAFAVTAGAAQAQVSKAEIAAIKSNCRSDYMANCMSVRPGGKEALQCLQSHLDSLSGACKSAVQATMPKPKPATAAAPPPQPAAGPPPPKAAAAPSPPKAASAPPPAAPEPPATEAPAAAKATPATTTPAKAKKAVAKTAPVTKPIPPIAPVAVAPPAAIPTVNIERLRIRQKLAIYRACRVDQQAVCSSVRPGSGRVIVCLAQHAGALSPGCKREMLSALR
jgi:hypothetical protein